MSKKKALLAVIILVLGVLINIGIISHHDTSTLAEKTVNYSLTVNSDTKQIFQIYYLRNKEKVSTDFRIEESQNFSYDNKGKDQTINFSLPADVTYLRFDFGNQKNITTVKNVKASYNIFSVKPDIKTMLDTVKTQDLTLDSDKNMLVVHAKEGDPFFVWDVKTWNLPHMWNDSYVVYMNILKVFSCAAFDLILLGILLKFNKILSLPKELIANRKLIFHLSKSDFKTRFAGSFFGIVWAFIQPIVTVLVYWFVFEKGLHSSGVNTRAGISVPFVLWLIAGLVPWFFFSEALSGGTNALMEYSYLVKKVVFKISILPIVKVFSAVFVHIFFLAFTIIMFGAYRYFPDLYTLQIFYYSFALFVFTLALVYMTCSLVVFFRDLTQIINIILQIGVWVTPIMWNIDTMHISPILIWIFKLNPLYYVVAGYRDALINKVWFWDHVGLTSYFWILTLVLLAVGSTIFKRLKVHFADVL